MHAITITDAKSRLGELVREADAQPVTLLRHGRPVAVIISAEAHERLLDTIEDLEDRLALIERANEDTVDFDKVKAELGIA